MRVTYKNKKMEKLAKDPRELRRVFGENERSIRKCLDTLRAVPNLAELFEPPFRRFRCHLLHNDKKGTYSLDVKDPYRLLFTPKEPVPIKSAGGIDVTKVEAVCVLELAIDTHR
ncbi:MAG: killer suppression protein [bacterium]|nr:killer suppression protein [bacterium]